MANKMLIQPARRLVVMAEVMAESPLTNLNRAIARLMDSDTPRKRKNARLEFQRAMRELGRGTLAEYPAMRADGSIITPGKLRGVRCPICEVPMRTTRMLAEHLFNRHRKVIDAYSGHNINQFTCICGEPFHGVPSGITKFTRHLARLKDLKLHFAKAQFVKLISERFADILENDLNLDKSALKVASWSLSSCQGDGVAFQGSIEASNVVGMRALMAECLRAKRLGHAERHEFLNTMLPDRALFRHVRLLEKYGVEWCCKVKHDGHYCHWNSMDVEVPDKGYDYGEYIDSLGSSAATWGCPIRRAVYKELTRQVDEALTAIEKIIDQWTKDLSRRFEKIGYDELEYLQKDREEEAEREKASRKRKGQARRKKAIAIV